MQASIVMHYHDTSHTREPYWLMELWLHIWFSVPKNVTKSNACIGLFHIATVIQFITAFLQCQLPSHQQRLRLDLFPIDESFHQPLTQSNTTAWTCMWYAKVHMYVVHMCPVCVFPWHSCISLAFISLAVWHEHIYWYKVVISYIGYI